MRGLLHRYRDRLPATESGDAPLTLGEGGTPLVRLTRLPADLSLPPSARLWAKIEGANPTGSFKDRGMVVAVAAARAAGKRCLICASTGNTSASAAAYAARAGLACVVLVPAGKIAAGKMAQATAHGAHIVSVNGNFDDAMRAVRERADDGDVAVVNSINPYRLQGQKTAAFEIIETLARAPDYHALPVGNAGNITAHWIGYCEAAGRGTRACGFADCGESCAFAKPLAGGEKPPKMLGYQAAGAAPFLAGAPVKNPQTVATAIRIGNPQSFDQANIVAADSGGRFAAVDDEMILQTQRMLAAREGVFCEPASAASVAGVVADIKSGLIAGGDIVCTLTGHGLKDADAVSPATPPRAVAVADLPETIAAVVAAHVRKNV